MAGKEVVPWQSAKLSSLKSPAGKADYIPPACYHLPPGFIHPLIHSCAINGKRAASGVFSLLLAASTGGQRPPGPTGSHVPWLSQAGATPGLC